CGPLAASFACGSSSTGGNGGAPNDAGAPGHADDAADSATTTLPGDAASPSDSGTPPSDASAGGVGAATQTAESSASCAAAQPFYWEIGDVNGALASGSVGGTTY